MRKQILKKYRQKNNHNTKSLMAFLQKKINRKTFVTEIYFDKNSKETFQDKMLKVIHSKGK